MVFIYVDDFEAGTLSTDYTNETPAVSVATDSARTGRYGLKQIADGTNAGIATLADAFLPDGYTYAFINLDFKQVAHTSGNSPVFTIQNRTGADHFDLFINYNTDSKFWWDMVSTDNAQSASAVQLDTWYNLQAILYLGSSQWRADVWIDGVKQTPIISNKTASDVRALHIGGFGTDVNTRKYDNLVFYLLQVDPRTLMAFQNMTTEDLLRLFLLKFITATDITEFETSTSDYLGKLVNTAGDVLNTDDVVA